MLYNYSIETTTGQAEGTIDSNSSEEAKDELKVLYAHNSEEAAFVDSEGQPVEHQVISVVLRPVQVNNG